MMESTVTKIIHPATAARIRTQYDAIYPPIPLSHTNSEIRLLQIHIDKEDDDDEIHCSLYVCDFRDAEFFALSYVWGDPTLTTRIHVNGHDFAATNNLVAYLRNARNFFRKEGDCTRSDPLWIDAICINQSDIPERNREVKRMDAVYKSAIMVAGWLGPSDESSSRALACARDIFQPLKKHMMDPNPNAWLRDSEVPMQLRDAISRKDTDQGLGNKVWNSLSALLDRTYWHRVWVVQELALGRTVALYCGDDWITLDNLILISHWLGQIVGTGAPEAFDIGLWSSISSRLGYSSLKFRPLERIFNFRVGNVGRLGSAGGFDVVSLFRGYGATDPRDNIYGLLGLVNLEIEPDYSPSNSAAQVYEDYTVSWIKRYSSLNILHMAYLRKTDEVRVQNLPSWTPDWSSNIAASYSWPGEEDDIKVTGDTTWSIVDHKLRCSAHLGAPIIGTTRIPRWEDSKAIIDLIEMESEPEHLEANPLRRYMKSNILRILLEDGFILAGKRIYGSYLYIEMALVTMLILCATGDPHKFEKMKTYMEDALQEEGTKELILQPMKVIYRQALQTLSQIAAGFMSIVVDVASHIEGLSKKCLLFFAADGFVGHGSQLVQVGDVIGLIGGCRTPLVLRKMDEEYLIICPSFVPLVDLKIKEQIEGEKLSQIVIS
jgi:hypothetical protein